MFRSFVAASAAALSAAAPAILTNPCSATVGPNQTFVSTCDASNTCTFSSPMNGGTCISSDGEADTSPLVLKPCDGSDAQRFAVATDGSGSVQQLPKSNGLCWNVDGGPNEPAGTGIILYNCGARSLRGKSGSGNANDIFTINYPHMSQIFSNSSGDSGLCFDISPPPPPPPPPFEWAYLPGQLGGADALPPATLAIADAEAACMAAANPPCYGISWQGPLNPAAPQLFSFKTQTVPSAAPGWQTLLRCGVVAPC
jgi:hypothetical protein